MRWFLAGLVVFFGCFAQSGWAEQAGETAFPLPLASYPTVPGQSLWETLRSRVAQEPFNLVATIIFFLAVVHTFLAPVFSRLSHKAGDKHRRRLEAEGRTAGRQNDRVKAEVSFTAVVFHFLGEVEAIFGLWVIPLIVAWVISKDWTSARDYLVSGVTFTEPLFVVVVMAISASRPVLRLAEAVMAGFASLGGRSPAAWWISILTIGPLLGSLITEPAAMTISALLLGRKFFDRHPPASLAYATVGLLFVNVSVGGTLTQFAAPPVLMVSGKWGWSTSHMLAVFGWRAALGIVISSVGYWLLFRRQFQELSASSNTNISEQSAEPIPIWVTLTTMAFLAWTILNNHYSVLIVAGFLFYLAFVQATEHHQYEVSLRPPLLVGFFLAGLVVHGGLQGWWIDPVLRSLGRLPLFTGATVLTAFNDNAAITFLASQVPDFSEGLKYAVVAGAVTGGGLTVIANAPNPAGQSILTRYFPDGISAVRLFIGALIPTIILALCFMLL